MNSITIDTAADEFDEYKTSVKFTTFSDDDPSDGHEILMTINDSFLLGLDPENVITRFIVLDDIIRLRDFLDTHIKNLQK